MANAFQAASVAAAAEVPLLPFSEAQALERHLFQAVAARGFGCDWRVWRTHQALIVPSLTTHAPGFRIASEEMTVRGWPVFVRDTGGDVTPQSPGIVNATAAFVVPRTPDLGIRETYERFCAPLLAFLGTMGIDAYLSKVSRSFCDGAFNIVVGGKKLAGTAQRWRLTTLRDGRPGVAVLAHAAILVDARIAPSMAATNEFYRLCGDGREVDPAQHVSLLALLPNAPSDAEPFSAQLSAFLAQWS